MKNINEYRLTKKSSLIFFLIIIFCGFTTLLLNLYEEAVSSYIPGTVEGVSLVLACISSFILGAWTATDMRIWEKKPSLKDKAQEDSRK